MNLFLGEAIPRPPDFTLYAKIYHNVFIAMPKSLASSRTEKTKERGGSWQKTVLIGRTQLMNYMLAGVSLFHGGATSLRYGMR